MIKWADYQEFEIECLSPVFIGSGESIQKREYISFRDKIGIISQGKWIQLLSEKRKLDSFISYIQNNSNQIDLYRWLRESGFSEADMDRAISRYIKRTSDKVNEISLGITTPEGQLYIPGSSIKGVFRSAIMYHMIKNSEDYKISAKDLNAEVKAFMQELSISDAMPVSIDGYSILAQTKGKRNTLPQQRECISANSKFRLSISLSKNRQNEEYLAIRKNIQIHNIFELLQAVKGYTREVLKLQLEKNNGFFANLPETKVCDFSLGGGTGFLHKSLIHMEKFKRGNMDIIRRFKKVDYECVLESNKKHPKTATVNGRELILGLCRLNEV